jgi:hypothetical protein
VVTIHAHPGAKVTADPARIAYVRHELAMEALLAVRPGQKHERELARQVVDLAASALSAAIAENKAHDAASAPEQAAETPSPVYSRGEEPALEASPSATGSAGE